MAAVFKELVIEWKEKEYRITPTMRLINRIEQEVSLSDIAQRILRNRAPLSHIALVVAIFLNSAGANVSQEEVYSELMVGDENTAGTLMSLILEVVFPQMGKDEAPATEKEEVSKIGSGQKKKK